MNTRLKVLSGLLVLSIIYAAITFISENRESENRKPAPNQVEKKPKTNRKTTKVESDEIVIVNNYKEFKPASQTNKKITNWGPDPFQTKIVKRDQSTNNINETIRNRDPSPQGYVEANIKIESVARIGEVAIVIINGQRYHEGDRIQNLVIDKIESKTVTFVMGNTKIIKNVGK